jgi:photosystem II stability/assembly factor-like uncharacterized protein
VRAVVLAALLAAVGLGAAACGGHTYSAQTTTTATTPIARPVPASFAPAAFSMPSANDVWILGSADCGSGSCAALVHSTDGGAHFSAVAAPRSPARQLDSIRFANANDGYVYDGHAFGKTAPLWETSDGGAHWWRVGFDDLLALGIGGGRALAVTATCTNGNCHGLSLRTAPVGGDTWTTTSIASTKIDPIVALTTRGTSIWLSVSDTTSTQASQTLLYSSNGGKTFTAEKSPCVPGLGGLLTSSSATLWADCPTGMLATPYRSTDAGATWSTLHVGHEIANSSQLVPASDSTAVLATGDQSQLLRTTDAGRSFDVVQGATPGYWNRIAFADAMHGYALRIAAAGQAILKLYGSDDAGATWHVLPIR